MLIELIHLYFDIGVYTYIYIVKAKDIEWIKMIKGRGGGI